MATETKTMTLHAARTRWVMPYALRALVGTVEERQILCEVTFDGWTMLAMKILPDAFEKEATR
jgi:hypothetical protein